jgi:hypothetical protein
MIGDVTVRTALAGDLPWIAELERRHYGGMRAVAASRIRIWYDANPKGFLVICLEGEPAGHATLLPLRPSIAQDLIDGSKGETDIEAADIYGPEERDRVRTLYVESVIAQPIELFGHFVGGFQHHVADVADPHRLDTIYLCPTTRPGRLIVSNLGFQRIRRPDHALDDPPLYAASFAALARRTASFRAAFGLRLASPGAPA